MSTQNTKPKLHTRLSRGISTVLLTAMLIPTFSALATFLVWYVRYMLIDMVRSCSELSCPSLVNNGVNVIAGFAINYINLWVIAWLGCAIAVAPSIYIARRLSARRWWGYIGIILLGVLAIMIYMALASFVLMFITLFLGVGGR